MNQVEKNGTGRVRMEDSGTSLNQGYYHYSRPEIQKLVNPTARHILDVGCAAGMLGYELKQKRGAEVWGVECESGAAEQAKKRLDRVLIGTVEEMLPLMPDGYFDSIILADVLEHLTDPWKILGDIKKKLSKNGEIVVSIPNIRHWSVVKSLLEGNWRYEDAGILDRTHLRFFTRAECVRLFETAGYFIVRSEAIVLQGDNQIPAEIVHALQKNGLNVETLAEESLHYQYSFVAKPVPPTLQAIALHNNILSTGLTSIIIITWNQLAHTQACLASIAEYTTQPYELIVIDNGSNDGTVDWLQEQSAIDTRIHLIENGENRGFAAGCNQGIELVHGDYILLLNNDTVVTTGWLTGLREVLDRYPDAGIVGPMTNSASGVQVVANVGYSSLEEFQSWAIDFRKNYRYRVVPQRRIVGFCMLFKRELPEKIGLLDESFGSGNFEDDDYCLRAELAGYRNMIAGDVFVHHVGGATFFGNRINYSESMMRNMVLYRNKWNYSTLDEVMLRRLVPLDAIKEAVRLALRGEIDTSIELLMQKGIRIAPDYPAPYLTLAEILMAAGSYNDALQVLPEMPAATDRVVKCEIEAICHAALGNDDTAWHSASQGQESHRALVVLGALTARRGDLTGAEKFFRRAIEANPSCGGGWLSLGMLFWSQEKQSEAWQAVRCSVVVDPLDAEAVRIMVDMAARLFLSSDALTVLSNAVQLYPDSINLCRHYAALLATCDHVSEALDACEDFLVRFGVNEEILALALQLRQQIGVYDSLVEGGGDSISLCIIVKNEENYLSACLASIKPVVHEMIVVDTGSTDYTADIATAFGAKVYNYSWNGNFSDARNCAINEGRGAWIFVMDADEVLAAKDYEAVRDSVNEAMANKIAWSVLTRNYTRKVHAHGWTSNDGSYATEERAEGWHPSWKVRLFRNQPEIRFAGEVHEMVEGALLTAGYMVNTAPFVIHHYGGLERNSGKVAEKGQRYFDIGLKKLEKNPHDAAVIAELAVQAGEMGDFEEAIQLWDRLLDSTPDNIEALFNKGYALIKVQRYQEALEISERVLVLEPDHKEAAFNYGTSTLYVGEPDKAVPRLESLLLDHPEYPPLLAILTLLYLLTGQRNEAIFTYSQLRKLNYAVTDYAQDRANVLVKLGKEDLARKLLEECKVIGILQHTELPI